MHKALFGVFLSGVAIYTDFKRTRCTRRTLLFSFHVFQITTISLFYNAFKLSTDVYLM